MATGPQGAFNLMGQLGRLGAMSDREIAEKAAMTYRDFESEHPFRGFLAGATPGLGHISNVALAMDPRLSVPEKLVEGTVGEIGGRAAGKAANKAITIGSRGIANLIRSGLTDKILGKTEAKIFKYDRTGQPVLHRSMEMAELSDENVRLLDAASDPAIRDTKLEQLIDAPDLFAAYPYLKNMHVEFGDELSDYRGAMFMPDPSGKGGGSISVSGTRTVDMPGLLKTILHETQHAVQTKEAWDHMFRGANYNIDGLRNYWVNPGEAQARVTEIRKDWTPSERAALPKFVHDKAEMVRSAIDAKVAEAFGVDVDSPLDMTGKNTMGTISHYMKNRQFVTDNMRNVVPHWMPGQPAGNLAMLAKMDEPTQDLIAQKLIAMRQFEMMRKMETAKAASIAKRVP